MCLGFLSRLHTYCMYKVGIFFPLNVQFIIFMNAMYAFG